MKHLPNASAAINRIYATDTATLPACAWPGGYAMVYTTSEGDTLCAVCALADARDELAARVDGYYHSGEVDPETFATRCDNCNCVIIEADEDADTDEE